MEFALIAHANDSYSNTISVSVGDFLCPKYLVNSFSYLFKSINFYYLNIKFENLFKEDPIMAISLALIILLGILFNYLFNKLKLPGLLGMLLLGIIIGPYSLNLIDESLLTISADLRKIALIIILLRAGFGINRCELKSIGKSALKMSCIPGILEGFSIAIAATFLLDFTFIQGGILGFIIAAVSPAVVVPQMINLLNLKRGTDKNIPTLILAAASIDDVFAITLMTVFMGLYGGHNINIAGQFLGIPISIFLGIGLGFVISLILIKTFKLLTLNNTQKVLIVLASAIFITYLETVLAHIVTIASLLGVMTLSFILMDKEPVISTSLSESFNKIWVLAEILLFVLVGAQVNISIALKAGIIGTLLIVIGLIFRSLGVWISLINTNLNTKEKLFCIISYIPKATVQAAMGSVPLSMGVASGDIILAISVVSILITAPIGAISISLSSKKLLKSNF